jgi:hypothetical protein
MWNFLSNIWKDISQSQIGQTVSGLYDDIADSYVGQGIESAYDTIVGYDLPDTEFMGSDSVTGKTAGYLGTALEFAGGFMEVAAPAGATTQMPSSKRRRVSAPRSTAGAGQFNVSKSNLANLQFGYTPRVNDAIIKANASKVPSIQMAVAQMMNYNKSSGATIKLQGAKMPSVAARTKLPSFAPKYYG